MDQDLSKLKEPPEGMVMPYGAQLFFTIATHIPVVISVVLGVYNIIKKKSPALLYFAIGGYVSSLFEAIVDVNGMCYFPLDGQFVGIYNYDRAIPVFVVSTYSWFMGSQGYLFKLSLDSGRLTKARLWQGWVTTMLINFFLEFPMLLLGLYVYYGAQPFKVLGFPLWWLFVNTMIPMSGGFIVHKLSPLLQGWRSLLIILIVPMADGFSNAAIGFPMWCALNSEMGYEATYPAFFATAGLAILTVSVISSYLPSEPAKDGTDREREPLLR
ncbi:hypothetical protein BDV18DRAFT_156167 [Aspergillus unguis]